MGPFPAIGIGHVSLVIEQLARAAVDHPDRVAIRTASRSVRFGELPFLAAVAANRLNRADPGQGPVAVLLPDYVDWIIAHLGARQLGRGTIHASANLPAAELQHCLEALGASAMLTCRGVEALASAYGPAFAGNAFVQISCDAVGVLDFVAFTERDMVRLGRGLTAPQRDGLDGAALPDVLANFYAQLLRGETCAIAPGIPIHISRAWEASVREPRAAMLLH